MHEASIVASLLERVEAEARCRGAVAVHAVHLDVGELSGVEVDLLTVAYETFRETGVCNSASLSVRRVPARWDCPRCGATLEGTLRCAACETPGRLVEGGEILLRTIEMEVQDV